MGHVKRDIASCEQRKSQHAQIHSALFTQRQAVMKDTEVKNPFCHIYIYVKIIFSGLPIRSRSALLFKYVL